MKGGIRSLIADVWLETGRNNLWKISARGTVKLRLLHNKPNALREELAKDRAETRVSESNDFRHDQRFE